MERLNFSPPRLLLYPDELYCSSRLSAGIIFNYVLAALVLVLSISLGTRAAAVVAYFLRRRSRGKQRRSRRRRKGTDRADNYGAIKDP